MKKEDIRYSSGTVFEGITSISAVIESEHSDRKIIRVLYDKSREDKLSRQLRYLERKAKKEGFVIEASDRETLDGMTVGSSHGGLVAECTDRTVPDISEATPGSGLYVYIEGIEDPYNFGYALRSIYAAGADAVILPARNWMTAAGVVCRSSAGASELCRLYQSSDISFIEDFKRAGFKVVCADERGDRTLWDADLSYPVLLVVGGEKRGISSAVMKLADTAVRIDYGRDFKEALSAASAAAVLAFECVRQNR